MSRPPLQRSKSRIRNNRAGRKSVRHDAHPLVQINHIHRPDASDTDSSSDVEYVKRRSSTYKRHHESNRHHVIDNYTVAYPEHAFAPCNHINYRLPPGFAVACNPWAPGSYLYSHCNPTIVSCGPVLPHRTPVVACPQSIQCGTSYVPYLF